ncbi:auxin-responsive protein SAUR32-like [Miscanthus floridulus]|uniref:auxin-responsive protein SAUR32-like n=1 Tax=Miscanthus floridulus TaxID=154761 RepID=UPI00345AB0DB
MGVHRLKKQHSAPSLGGSGSGSGSASMPPKGCMAVRVVGPAGGGGGKGGRQEEEEERFVVPVGYLKHPLFVALLKAAEEEYGFEQKGAITIPCGVDHFRRVQGIIHHQRHNHHHHGSSGGGGGGGHHGHHSSNHFHIAGCFRA